MTTVTRPPAHRPPPTLVHTTPVSQVEESDCGAACLAMIAGWYGRHVPHHELAALCGGGRDGISAAALARAARTLGIEVRASRVRLSGREAEDLAVIGRLRPPAVVLLHGHHFAVLDGTNRRGQVVLNDPATGRREVSLPRFRETFAGIVLVPRPGTAFRPGGEPGRPVRRLAEWLRPEATRLLLAVLCGIVAALVPVAAAYGVRHLIGAVLDGRAPSTARLALLLGLAAGGVVVGTWLSRRLRSAVLTRLSLRRSDEVVSAMLRLPGVWFHRRFTGAVAARSQVVDGIAMTVSGVVVEAAVSATAVIVLAAAMLWFAPLAAVGVLLAAAGSALILRRAARRDADGAAARAADRALRDGEAMAGLLALETVKAEGGASTLFGSWARAQARTVDADARADDDVARHVGAAAALDTVGTAATVGIGALLVAHHHLGLDSLVAAMTLAPVLTASAAALGRARLQWSRIRTDLAQVGDVLDAPPDPRVDLAPVGPARTTPRGVQPVATAGRPTALPPALPGSVALCNVVVGHDINRPPVLAGVDLQLDPGERLVVCGRSGSGKSTLTTVVAGIVPPWSGTVRVGGHEVATLDRARAVATVGVVRQRPWLVEASVAHNVALGLGDLDDAAVEHALETACLLDVVRRRGGIHGAQVAQDGANFSGGERQRLALARALVRRPSVLVLDEHTSALETPLARRIDAALRATGATTLVVAHRLETVLRPGDRVLEVVDGRLGAPRTRVTT